MWCACAQQILPPVARAFLFRRRRKEREARKTAEQEAEARATEARGLERRLAAALEAAARAEQSAAASIEVGGLGWCVFFVVVVAGLTGEHQVKHVDMSSESPVPMPISRHGRHGQRLPHTQFNPQSQTCFRSHTSLSLHYLAIRLANSCRNHPTDIPPGPNCSSTPFLCIDWLTNPLWHPFPYVFSFLILPHTRNPNRRRNGNIVNRRSRTSPRSRRRFATPEPGSATPSSGWRRVSQRWTLCTPP